MARSSNMPLRWVVSIVIAVGAMPTPRSFAQGTPPTEKSAPPPTETQNAVAIEFGGVYLLQLARQKSVQADLGVSRTQSQKLDTFERTLQRQATNALQKGPPNFPSGQNLSGSRGLLPTPDTKSQSDAESGLKSILSEGQTTRLKQIALQQQGPQILLQPAVTAKLQLTNAQIKRISQLTSLDSNRLRSVLTGEQKAIWKEMIGAPFHGKMTNFNSRYRL